MSLLISDQVNPTTFDNIQFFDFDVSLRDNEYFDYDILGILARKIAGTPGNRTQHPGLTRVNGFENRVPYLYYITYRVWCHLLAKLLYFSINLYYNPMCNLN